MKVDEHTTARPSAALRPYVGWYSGYRQRGLPPTVHRGLPSPYLTVILTLDEPLVIAAHPDVRQAPGRYDALIGGLHLAPAIITSDGAASGIQVSVNPLGCRVLFGLPAAELRNIDTDLSSVLHPDVVDEVRERLRAVAGWAERFAVVDRWLCGRMAAGEARVHPDVARAFRRLVASGGDVPIAALAGEVGWSARRLTTRFAAEVGLRPKEAARVVRFDRVRRRIAPGVRLAEVAADGGYFDQAHLTRDFREFAGVPPTRWLADEFGNVQATTVELDQV